MRLGRDNLDVVRAVEHVPRPLVTSELYGALLSLEHDAPPGLPVLLLSWGEPENIPRGFSDVFVLYPSASLRRRLVVRGWRLEPTTESQGLWHLTGRRDTRGGG